ncbi:MAG: hypothetical protein ACOVQ3_12100 [Dolichospermum sp.]|jgi:cytoskeletal protein CcmA (bactofilin family)
MPKSKTDFTNFVDARPNYFPGQFLLEDDFEVEQKYLIDRQKYHRQSLHVSGIVEGLEVEVINDRQEVQIKSGSGINSNGDLIVLKKDTSFSQFASLTNGELYISYREEKQVKQQEDFTRWQEVPTIGFADTTPNHGVKLAKISIVNNVLTLDLTVRDYSGIFLPNATGNDLTLRSGGNANPNVAILNGSLTVTGTITGKIDATNINSGVLAVDRIPNLPANKITAGTTTGNLTIGGNLRVTGSLTADNKITVPGNQKIEFTDTDVTNNLKLQLWSGYGLGINASTLFYAASGKHSWRDNNGTNERMVLTTGADGSLTVNGTGTSSFAGNLTVSGSLSFGTSVKQMINLWSNNYGIGIQGNTQYFRTYRNFAWYKEGTHNDAELNPGGGTAEMVIKDGNVGIGTVTPSEKLEVSGNLKVTGTITGNNVFLGDVGHGSIWAGFSHSSQVGQNSYAILQHHTGTWTLINKKSGGGFIGFRIDNNDKMIINDNGNVGIGTTTPSEKLEINGNLKVTGNITTESWQTPSLQNGWVIYQETTGNPPRPIYNPPGYFKDSFGIVHLRGLVQNGGGTIFTLPVGYRPAYRELQAVQTWNNTIGRLDVHTDGQVIMQQGNNGWFSLDGVTFRAAL